LQLEPIDTELGQADMTKFQMAATATGHPQGQGRFASLRFGRFIALTALLLAVAYGGFWLFGAVANGGAADSLAQRELNARATLEAAGLSAPNAVLTR